MCPCMSASWKRTLWSRTSPPATANAIYELGVRHALRPHTTIITGEDSNTKLAFDLSALVAAQTGEQNATALAPLPSGTHLRLIIARRTVRSTV